MTRRDKTISVRVSPEEEQLCELLAEHLGVDKAGIMRMALRKLAREEGIVIQKQE